MAKTHVTMKVNGAEVEGLVEPRTLLVHFIRENLQMTGTHIGCETTHCGACTIDIDGMSVKSCTMFAVQAPQWVVSQPIWVPVSTRFSRMKCSSSVRGSTRPSTSAPFTFMVTWVFAICPSLKQPGLRRATAPASP